MADVLGALSALPEDRWAVGDDLCDCTYQRIFQVTNPYLGETLEMRLCCIWDELTQLFPAFVRRVPAYFDINGNEWVREPQPWNGETDMPPALWYRQLARLQGRSVADIREEYRHRDAERPRGVARPVEPTAEPEPDMLGMLLQIVMDMANRMDALEAK
jgi:hypothetical protein